MFTRPISIIVIVGGAVSFVLALGDGPNTPTHWTILACGSFLVGVGLIALALFESAEKK